MFCYQCEQTSQGTGCSSFGVCGKSPDVASLQDLLMYQAKLIAKISSIPYREGDKDYRITNYLIDALFTAVTNVNFSVDSLVAMINRSLEVLDIATELSEKHGVADSLASQQNIVPVNATTSELVDIAESLILDNRIAVYSKTIVGLQELILYGLKGSCAYLDHAKLLGYHDDSLNAFLVETLAFLADKPDSESTLIAKALEVGDFNLRVMELLDKAHNETFGVPEPTMVSVTPKAGKAILVSGHDLGDLQQLLIQTEGLGINIYTHGEMITAHSYPELKKFPHLVGHYGTAWQNQRREFDLFPGAILMTTNCIQLPKSTYRDRIFTTDLVAYEGVKHLPQYQYSELINEALRQPGFDCDGGDVSILVGFGHKAALSHAEKIIQLVKDGAIRHFFLIGGCDGAKPGRNYYTKFATQVPDDCIILTLACGKYRFNNLDFGSIDGIPRLLDCGQCNDAYSAIKIASALADAFDCTVNDLPLSFILSWYEQKAVAILLTLLSLGIKHMRLGPSLPAFITEEVLNILVEKFDIKPITTPEEDLADILNDSEK
ncbi:hydroxylamine reductase [Lentisphaerota bacterium WC36G]|nr:hydroxylamine reductase [Lentisphaerae bacterium WC36]